MRHIREKLSCRACDTVVSAPASPLQIFGGSTGSEAIWSLPWSNIPTLLVPFYIVTHGIIFAQLARTRASVLIGSEAKLASSVLF